LRQLPLLVKREELQQQVHANREWYIEQLMEVYGLDAAVAAQKGDDTLAALFEGWRDPVQRRTTAAGTIVEETGVPLRAMVAYLFGEVAKCFHMIHHSDQWIEYVTRSQRGDRCVDIAVEALPPRELLESELDWERETTGPERLNRWLGRCGATPFDYNRNLDDESLSPENPPDFRHLEGTNFFRGLALIDLAEAMLKRAFGQDAIAVRVNAAGQGDYFQVHVDRPKAAVDEVKTFIRTAFYRRFGLRPVPEFVELYSGGGASGVRLSRYDALPQLIQRLQNLNNK